MTKVVFGNHAAIRVSRTERAKIREFFCDVLGGTLTRTFGDKDDIKIGDDFYIAFLYAGGDGQGAEKGANYAADNPLDHNDFLKAIFLEIKAEDVDSMRRKIVDFGVNELKVPDPHLYFQAPGGQVLRLVGIDEDLSHYEG